jgi:hypothetical protein
MRRKQHGTFDPPGGAAPRALHWIESVIGSTRHSVRRVITRYPSIYMPIARYRHPEGVLRPDTELVIDGFPRSANTFALVGFQVAQDQRVRVAHHIHAPAHLIAAARRGVPMLVPIREPAATVVSAKIGQPEVLVSQWLRSYIDFYELLPLIANSVVVAPFKEVTTNLAGVIRRVNERFGTSYRELEATPERIATVFQLIDERSRRPPWEHLVGHFLGGRLSLDEYWDRTAEQRSAAALNEVPEDSVPRPSQHREAVKARMMRLYMADRLASLRGRAQRAYEIALSVAQ